MGKRLLTALVLSCLALAAGRAAAAPTEITIATGVDPSFSAFYIAKGAGIFERNGLDVQLNTGPSGSAMIAFVIRNQIQAAFGAEQAGVQAFNLDSDVVCIAEGALLERWYGLVGRDIDDLAGLKRKKLGIARGSGSEVFWLALVDKLKLEPKDYNIVDVEAPEMVAAIERRDSDAFSAWEPWVTRAVGAVPNTKLLRDNQGIIGGRVHIYANKSWIVHNPAASLAFMRSLVEATDMITTNRPEAVAQVAKFLNLDRALTEIFFTKLRFDIRLDQDSIDNFKIAQAQLKSLGKLAKPLDWKGFIYPDLLRQVRPEKVNYVLPE